MSRAAGTRRTIRRGVIAAGFVLVAGSPAFGAEGAGNACLPHEASCAALIFQGLTYPYRRPDTSYLYVDGGTYPYVEARDDLLGTATVALPDGTPIRVDDLLSALGLGALANDALVPVAGYGSNPAPSQLRRKFAQAARDEPVVMAVMKGEVEGYDVVWTPFFTQYGAMPSTIFPSPGTTVDIWINWMRAADVTRMDATESIGRWYVRTPLEGAVYRFEGPQPDTLQVYVSCSGALAHDGAPRAVASVPARGRRYDAMSSMEALGTVLAQVSAPDVLSLLYANVSSEAARSDNSARIAGLAHYAGDEGPFARGTCGGN